MNIADMLLEIANDLPRVFAAGEAKHTSRYVSGLALGDGTKVITIDSPFEPDCFFVTAHGADANSAKNSVLQMFFDRRTFARIGGFYRINQNGSVGNGNFTTASGGNYLYYADGKCVFEIPSSLGVTFVNGAQYAVAAVKITDKSDRELLEEEISLLEESGDALSYSSARVLATVSEEEWQTLIATKPNRTFTLS